MPLPDEVEKAVQSRKLILESITQQNNELMSLEAYRMTIVKSICKEDVTYTFPLFFRGGDSKITRSDEKPFFVLNGGSHDVMKNREGKGTLKLPINYRCLRRFSRYTGAGSTWYTSTVLYRNDSYYFIIKDDENTVWKGADAFREFRNSFTGEFPFQTIDEWLGLESAVHVQNPVSYGKDWKYTSSPGSGGKKSKFGHNHSYGGKE